MHGYEWLFDDIVLVDIQRWAARLNIRLVGDTPADNLHIRTRERLTLGDWYHLGLTYDGKGKAAGLRLYLNGRALDVEVVRDALAGSMRSDAPLPVGSKPLGSPFRGQLDDFRIYDRTLAPGEVEQLALHYRARAILSGVTGKRSRDEAAVPARLLPDVRRAGRRCARRSPKRGSCAPSARNCRRPFPPRWSWRR